MSKGKGLSRRDFLHTAGAAGLGSLLLGGEARAAGERPGTKKETGDLPRRKFGKTGEEVTILSLGGIVEYTDNQLLLKEAWARGLRYWDTAAVYNGGKSETGYGQYFAKNPGVREKLFVVTKSGRRNPEGLTRELNRSLERMQTDYVDLFFFHGVSDISRVDRKDIREWAERMKKEKKIRFIGLSTHKNMAPVLAGAAKLGWIEGLMPTYNYRIMHDDDMKRAVDACAKAGIGITAMKTQGGGPINDTKADRELAGHFVEKGYTPEQAKVKAVLENPQIAAVCSQMPSVEVLHSNVAAVLDRTKLNAADRRALDRHAKATCASTCAACGNCERTAGLPVPEVMRYMMYARNYGEPGMARERFAALPVKVRRRLATADFRRAERSCPRELPIGRLMKEACLELA